MLETKMSDSTSAELAARTVYRNKEGKKVTRAELLAERVREKRVKVPIAVLTEEVDSRRTKKRALRLECRNSKQTTGPRTYSQD